jgi:hypothetical protein
MTLRASHLSLWNHGASLARAPHSFEFVSAPTSIGVSYAPIGVSNGPDVQPREPLALVAPERDWNGWVSASRTRNFVLRDPLLDWLEVYGEQNGFVRDDALASFDARTDFARFVINKGHAFELAVMTLLRSRCEVCPSVRRVAILGSRERHRRLLLQ